MTYMSKEGLKVLKNFKLLALAEKRVEITNSYFDKQTFIKQDYMYKRITTKEYKKSIELSRGEKMGH